jgi:glycerate kinase
MGSHSLLIARRPNIRANLSSMSVATVAPDKFKGTLAAAAVAAAMARGARTAGFEEVRVVPMADGGDGTLDAVLAAVGGSRRTARVTGPLGDAVDAEWALLGDGTAVVEMARASGLLLVEGRNDPLRASSRGTGELVAAALRSGAARVVVGVGGSASTDGGLGAVDALGWSLAGADVVVASDVNVRFADAARRFAPQKGASDAQVSLLTRRLERLAQLYESRTGVDVRDLAGGGAAGGLAGGLAAIGARIEAGFEVVARIVGLERAMEGSDLVLTGEGRLDASSLDGKVVGGVLEWATELGIEHRGVVVGQATSEGRDEASLRGARVEVLVERVWQAGEAFARTALLVEEASLDLARRARSAAAE